MDLHSIESSFFLCRSKIHKLGMIELWYRLRLRGYTRRLESLYRVTRRFGMFQQPRAKNTCKPKPYEQMCSSADFLNVNIAIRQAGNAAFQSIPDSPNPVHLSSSRRQPLSVLT